MPEPLVNYRGVCCDNHRDGWVHCGERNWVSERCSEYRKSCCRDCEVYMYLMQAVWWRYFWEVFRDGWRYVSTPGSVTWRVKKKKRMSFSPVIIRVVSLENGDGLVGGVTGCYCCCCYVYFSEFVVFLALVQNYCFMYISAAWETRVYLSLAEFDTSSSLSSTYPLCPLVFPTPWGYFARYAACSNSIIKG